VVADLARRIRGDYAGKDLLLIGLLKGSFVFMADLMRALDMPAEVDFMSATSYSGRESTGELVILKGLNESVHERNVLIVEDIIDTGLTLSRIRERLLLEGPASLEIVTLIDKPARRQAEVPVKYVGRAGHTAGGVPPAWRRVRCAPRNPRRRRRSEEQPHPRSHGDGGD